jgi:SAM-dependent methyltransferase
MSEAVAIWDQRYATGDGGAYDPWLERWKAILVGHGDRALELGCGVGYDTEVLTSWGLEVTALDVSQVAVGRSKRRNPGVLHRVMDLREIDRLEGGFAVVVASLSLHYFRREETISIFQSIHRLLNPDGVLAFRVNAYDDVESGAPRDASSWQRVSVHGVSKQFFTVEKLATVLRGQWQIVSQEKLTTLRYGHRKSFFEVLARKHIK